MKTIKYLWLFLFLISCTPISKMYTSSINDVNNLDNTSAVYSLPRTVFKMAVTVRKAEFLPGPYAAFADKYMGIKNASNTPSVSWSISDVKIDSYSEPDPDFYFAVSFENDPEKFVNIIDSFDHAGLIITPFSMTAEKSFYSSINLTDKEDFFNGISIKKNMNTEKETTYKTVFQDSAYVQVPVENSKTTIKSTEAKAQEASDFIIKLRKRKFKMLTGQNETTQIDEGIQSAIDELNKTEEEFLSLFTGKKIITEETKYFEYIPLATKEADQPILFKISEKDGILEPISPKGNPVFLEINNTNNTKIFEKFVKTGIIEKVENSLFYRIPEIVKIVIKEDDKILLEGKAKVFQKGALLKVNASY